MVEVLYQRDPGQEDVSGSGCGAADAYCLLNADVSRMRSVADVDVNGM